MLGPEALQCGTDFSGHHFYRLYAVYLTKASLPAIMIDDWCSLVVEALNALFKDSFCIIVTLLKLFPVQVTDTGDDRRLAIDVVNVTSWTNPAAGDAVQQLVVNYPDTDCYNGVGSFALRKRFIEPISLRERTRKSIENIAAKTVGPLQPLSNHFVDQFVGN